MKVYYIKLPTQDSILKLVSTLCKFGMFGLQILFFLGYSKTMIIIGTTIVSIVNSVIDNRR